MKILLFILFSITLFSCSSDSNSNSEPPIVEDEFIPHLNEEHDGYAWVSFQNWPKPLHMGLRNTLQNKQNLTKLQTVFQVIDLLLHRQ